MAWSDELIDRLRSPSYSPRFLLESVEVGQFKIEGARQLRISSFDVDGYEHAIAAMGNRISYGELQIPAFTATTSMLTLGLTRDVSRQVTRGLVVQLRIGFAGWPPDRFETVFVGCVRGLSYVLGSGWSLTVQDLAGSLTSRFVTSTVLAGMAAGLFDNLSETTISGGAYSAGDPTVNVASTTGFEQSNQGGGEGYMYLVTSNTGDGFLLLSTGKTGTTFTGTIGTALFGTTASAAANGNVVREVVYTKGHPLTLARRILVSTGTSTTSAAGSNGTADLLPEAWGYALPPAFVDAGDIAKHKGLSQPASGNDDWEVVEYDRQESGSSWMAGLLAPGGYFLTMRQGAVTARCLVDVERGEAAETWRCSDDDISELSYEPFDGRQPAEYRYLRLDAADGGFDQPSESTIDTRPVAYRREITLPYVWSNGNAICNEITARLRYYMLRVPERISIRTAGLHLAPATIGDCVRLTTSVVRSRWAEEGHDFADRPCLMVGGGPDWFRGGCQLELLAIPPSAGTSS
jgi:hypothetical protein